METRHSVGLPPCNACIFMGHFPQKSPMISGSFTKNDLQLKVSCGSLPPCNACISLSLSRCIPNTFDTPTHGVCNVCVMCVVCVCYVRGVCVCV